ncbi:MAG: PilZ domain-containing protein [Deltaproteobacteria bacterium]|nr:PilZ domain-containing protein [Deltaproteobacteria bacterium]
MADETSKPGSVPPESKPTYGQRRHERLTINKEFDSFDAFIQEYVTNISRSGVFIRAKNQLPIGTKVNLRFTVIMDDIETIEGTGEVVRHAEGGMGVVFRELTGYSQNLLEKLLVAREKTQKP